MGNIGNGDSSAGGPCPAPDPMQGPFVETVFVFGSPSPEAIAPTACPLNGNGNGDGNRNGNGNGMGPGNGDNGFPPQQPYPPVVTPAPPSPPLAPFPAPAAPPPYGPPPATCALNRAKDVSIDVDTSAPATSSFHTVTLSAVNARQQEFDLPGPSGYSAPGSGSGVAPGSGGAGTGPGNGGSGVAPGSGESVPPVVSASARNPVPAQVTVALGARLVPQMPILLLVFISLVHLQTLICSTYA